MSATVADLMARAQASFDGLALVAEPVEDEWQYVTDLGIVWKARLAAVAAARGTELVPPEIEAAIDALANEVRLIQDPHRAIDWLSTLPQVALAALGEAA
jgi:hypothetical protein